MSTQEQTIPDHPATFSKRILEVIEQQLVHEYERRGETLCVLDPFAGVGTIHELACSKFRTYGVEIQPEWAAAHSDTICMSVLDLPPRWKPEDAFDVIATSPCYGNRMADSHNAQERCSACGGDGFVRDQRPPDFDKIACEKCDGSGVRDHHRNTYTHKLRASGAEPVRSDDNAALIQWGSKYRAFHEQAWRACDSVLRADGLMLLNVKNHIRSDRVQRVVEFHVNTWLRMSYTLEAAVRIETSGLTDGENSDARTGFELVIALRKPA